MKSKALICLLLLSIIATALLFSLNACGAPDSPLSGGRIQHVVVIIQENRTPDNLFQDPVLITRGADIASSGLSSSGAVVRLTPAPLGVNYDLGHNDNSFLAMYRDGKMNGADRVVVYCDTGPPSGRPPHAQFKYVRPFDVAPYFQMAEQYTFGDRVFQTNQGPSFPAHQFLISGTSAPTDKSRDFVSENTDFGLTGGCNSPAWVSVKLIDPIGRESKSMYPCFEHRILTDDLDQVGLSWL